MTTPIGKSGSVFKCESFECPLLAESKHSVRKYRMQQVGIFKSKLFNLSLRPKADKGASSILCWLGLNHVILIHKEILYKLSYT